MSHHFANPYEITPICSLYTTHRPKNNTRMLMTQASNNVVRYTFNPNQQRSYSSETFSSDEESINNHGNRIEIHQQKSHYSRAIVRASTPPSIARKCAQHPLMSEGTIMKRVVVRPQVSDVVESSVEKPRYDTRNEVTYWNLPQKRVNRPYQSLASLTSHGINHGYNNSSQAYSVTNPIVRPSSWGKTSNLSSSFSSTSMFDYVSSVPKTAMNPSMMYPSFVPPLFLPYLPPQLMYSLNTPMPLPYYPLLQTGQFIPHNGTMFTMGHRQGMPMNSVPIPTFPFHSMHHQLVY